MSVYVDLRRGKKYKEKTYVILKKIKFKIIDEFTINHEQFN